MSASPSAVLVEHNTSEEPELPALETIIDVSALAETDADRPVEVQEQLFLDVPVSSNRRVLLQIPALPQGLSHCDISSASITLPDTTSYPAILDQSLPGADVGDLTATESMILPTALPQAMSALHYMATEDPQREPVKSRSGVSEDDTLFSTKSDNRRRSSRTRNVKHARFASGSSSPTKKRTVREEDQSINSEVPLMITVTGVS